MIPKGSNQVNVEDGYFVGQLAYSLQQESIMEKKRVEHGEGMFWIKGDLRDDQCNVWILVRLSTKDILIQLKKFKYELGIR